MILKNKKALITGGSGAIGKTTAEFFEREGCEVITASRSGNYSVDIASPESVKTLMNLVEKKFGSLDILVTAAGTYGEIGSLEQCDAEKWLDAIKVNLYGMMLSIKYALPMLKKNGNGKIIAFAGGGDAPLPNFTSYASSKGAVLRLVESLSKEFSDFGIEINAISPGLVNSGLTRDLVEAGAEKAGKDQYEAALKQTKGEMKTVSPEKAAELAVFLASGKSNGITGKNISAVWDKWQEFSNHLEKLKQSDIYNWRRIKPEDRGYDW
ncbi:MAG: dehydrogenase [Candidatus Giovannonibacteria bacterium GW2011_GWC2_44_9]|uniref:Dehydrogenase n=3 Tax=Candidatus Giovannoniibacteriota TaxID=1752738 RepID=A0A0G1IY50_9BACT|nr:MAG: dehydrogenase [Candidatus Giovannonibacteria bacterium GW2011_GWB1_44_23]KKT64336.1 MAG: dehydrogenase [Candidatus Giovannonibacteria bacterium GW2011_GWA1_44_29]KKT84290.1 MAG: dehydrogenase [Candidatus Giovannonibacteria bacterium GW2011_GWC2_44_9]KKT92063.1 MAG: dehydrogenase [Parcubacteria group bacterium GW2011_GWC1_45_13]